jgi:hypothetical protein
MLQNLETIDCTCCGNPFPKLRKELYGYSFCVNCSTVKPKVGRTLTLGEGDHTWNDLEILDQDTAKRVLELENAFKTDKYGSDGDLLDYNEEEVLEEVLETTKDLLKKSLDQYDPDKLEEQKEEPIEDFDEE